jgi:AmiR/NasT family two-component response regulator
MLGGLRAVIARSACAEKALISYVTQFSAPTPEEAFSLLRAVSQRRNIKLREVAANLVTAIQGRG